MLDGVGPYSDNNTGKTMEAGIRIILVFVYFLLGQVTVKDLNIRTLILTYLMKKYK